MPEQTINIHIVACIMQSYRINSESECCATAKKQLQRKLNILRSQAHFQIAQKELSGILNIFSSYITKHFEQFL